MRKTVALGFILVACCLALAAPKITSIIVGFDDGSDQQLAAAVTTQPATAPTTQPFNDGAFLGINLESLRDYDRQFMFIDVIKTSRRFGSSTKPFDQSATLGPDGWPTTDAGTLVMTEMKNINGVYRFFCTGRCDLTAPGTPAKVRNLTYNERTNRTSAEVVVTAPQDKSITFALAFKNTTGGVRDIKLLRPGYEDDARIFTNEFLLALKPFAAIRFMDYLRTNNSQVTRWDERCKPTAPQYTGTNGGPIEWAIQLGNLTGKDIWLNVPALADDDYVTQLGALVREKLKPQLHCYVEYSNEVWNGQFKQFKQNLELAKAEVAAGEKTLNDNGADQNQFYWARKRVAKRSVQIKQLVGDDPRFRVVLASQVAYAPPGAMIKQQLEYIAKYHGEPAKFIYAIASAPYFAPGRDETDPAKKKWYTQRADVSVDGICERLLARTATSANDNVKAFHALARKYGVKSFAYEGGLDLQQFSNAVDIKIKSQYDPRAGLAVEDYLNHWYRGGGDALFYFTLSSKYSKTGYWGLTEDVRDLTTPKYQGAARVGESLAH
jgi:hypothetical protein